MDPGNAVRLRLFNAFFTSLGFIIGDETSVGVVGTATGVGVAVMLAKDDDRGVMRTGLADSGDIKGLRASNGVLGI
jgi:hypothetical protein